MRILSPVEWQLDASQFEAYTSLRPGELAEDFSPKRPPFEMAVVPLLRHQGEMDSCGKDASGNE